MLKKIILLSIILIVNILSQTNIYVSLDGNDFYTGRLPSYTSASNGPYRTFDKAFAEILRLRLANQYPSKGINLLIRGGKYYITSPLTMGYGQRGNTDAPLKISPYNNETVIICGSTPITNFTLVTDQSILNQLDDSVESKVYVADMTSFANSYGYMLDTLQRLDLIYKGEQMNPSRYPKTGFIDFTNVVSYIADGQWRYKLKVSHNSRMSTYLRDTNIYAKGFWNTDYSSTYQRVYNIDMNTDYVVVTGLPSGGYKLPLYGNNQRFYLTNILSEVNLPNDYYFDFVGKKLYFYPNETMSEYPEFSNCTNIISMNSCSNVIFSNLILDGGYEGLTIISCGNVIVKNCTIRNNMENNIRSTVGNNITITNNKIYNSNKMSIFIDYSGDRVTLTKNNIKIMNNDIHDFGKFFVFPSAGIYVKESTGTYIGNNKIYNSPMSAIYLSGNDNLIENNNMYNVCYELQDVSAVYSWGDIASQGNILQNNYIHDIVNIYSRSDWKYRVIGFHTDDFSGSWIVRNNIFYNIGTGVVVEGGSNNKFKNNIFYKCGQALWFSKILDTKLATYIPIVMAEANRFPFRTSPKWLKYPRLIELAGDSLSFTMKYNEANNNIIVKVDSAYRYSWQGVATDSSGIDRTNNYVSNTNIPFDEVNLTFKINSYATQLNSIKFIPIPFNPAWKK